MPDRESVQPVFANYTYGRSYDEMFEEAGKYRPHYAGIHNRL